MALSIIKWESSRGTVGIVYRVPACIENGRADPKLTESDLDCHKIQIQAGYWQRTHCSCFWHCTLHIICCTFFRLTWLSDLHCHKIQVQVGSWHCSSSWHCILHIVYCSVHFSDLCASKIYTAIKYKFKWVVGRGPIAFLGTVFCISFTFFIPT